MPKIKVGFVDSGIGGLIFASDLISSLTKNKNPLVRIFFKEYVDFIHIGDTKNMPYGLKSEENLKKLVMNLIQLAVDQGCKVVIMACNTADTVLDEGMVFNFEKNGIKIIRIIKESATAIFKKTKVVNAQKNMLILATKRTIESGRYQDEIKKLGKNEKDYQTNVTGYFPENWEYSIEQGISEGELVNLFKQYYEKNKDLITKLNSIGLFCTHFPYFRKKLTLFVKKLNLKIQIFGQGKFFEKILIKTFKKEIESKFKNLEKLPEEGQSEAINILSYLTNEDNNVENYRKVINNFNKNLNIKFKFI